ncbi:hypothetical protein ACJJTC_017126 [Scirpophaga incertulas]
MNTWLPRCPIKEQARAPLLAVNETKNSTAPVNCQLSSARQLEAIEVAAVTNEITIANRHLGSYEISRVNSKCKSKLTFLASTGLDLAEDVSNKNILRLILSDQVLRPQERQGYPLAQAVMPFFSAI